MEETKIDKRFLDRDGEEIIERLRNSRYQLKPIEKGVLNLIFLKKHDHGFKKIANTSNPGIEPILNSPVEPHSTRTSQKYLQLPLLYYTKQPGEIIQPPKLF